MKALLLFCLICSVSCTGNTKLGKLKETDKFEYFAARKDSLTIIEIDRVLEENYDRICTDLMFKGRIRISVEIYPDQKSYDAHAMGRRGTPAASGNRKIQMVSPLAEINIPGIPYKERVMMAVHEFVHLLNNEINPNMPMWVEEGVAAFEGSYNIYEKICQIYFPALPEVSFESLEKDYAKVKGADIYSYSLISFIISKYGRENINLIIRNPYSVTDILKINSDEFNRQWNLFIKAKYKN